MGCFSHFPFEYIIRHFIQQRIRIDTILIIASSFLDMLVKYSLIGICSRHFHEGEFFYMSTSLEFEEKLRTS